MLNAKRLRLKVKSDIEPLMLPGPTMLHMCARHEIRVRHGLDARA